MQRASLRAIRAFILRRWVHPLNNLAQNLMTKEANWVRDGLIKAVIIASQLGRLVMTMLRVNVKRLRGSDWSVIYIGEEFSLEELRHVLFPSPASVDHLGRVFLWRVPALVRKLVNDGEFVVCELNRLVPWHIHAHYVSTVEPWVRQTLDISQAMDDILAGMNRNLHRNLRKVKSTGFTCEHTQEPAKFDIFYHRMYLPYIAQRHRDRAIISKYYEIRRQFDQGGLMLVKHKGQLVTGVVYQIIGDICRLGVMGVYEENSQLVNKGAIVALYWFMMDWARRHGLRTLDFGSSRARLADGAFDFKRQWGTHLEATLTTHISWGFIAESIEPELCRFLNAQGFLGRLDGEWWTVMFETPEVHLEKEQIERTSRMARKSGAAGVRILGYNEALSTASYAFLSAES